MERLSPTHDLANPVDLQRLNGRTVLVKSTHDRRNPPTAMRGTIEVRPTTAGAPPDVRLAIEFPQMFTSQAHHRTIDLSHAEVMRLVASEYNGTFEFEIEDELE